MRATLYDKRGAQLQAIRNVLSCGIPGAVVDRAIAENEWFTRESIDYALRAIVEQILCDAALKRWLTSYPDVGTGLDTAVIMAGNIPMAGFFDLLCAAVAGCRFSVKYSSKDRALMEWVAAVVAEHTGAVVSPLSEGAVADALIASGSDNAAFHIRSHFEGVPMLLRSHRSSVAVIDERVSRRELSLLWRDIFTYFTLGCRNVTHIYLPSGYSPEALAEGLAADNPPIAHRPWLSGYIQRRALMIMNSEPFTDGGYFMLSPKERPESLCEITYSFYGSADEVAEELDRRDDIQCVVGHGYTPFGMAQRPAPWDYPDGRDIIEFLFKTAERGGSTIR